MKRWLKSKAYFLLLPLIVGGVFTLYICLSINPVRKSEEVVLMQNLWAMRRAIDFYWHDCEKPPQSLQELISAGYLREIPIDPVTKSNQTWIIERAKESSVPNAQPGIIDLRSSAAGADKNGKPYNEY
jgi:general secretion pathway protein G